MTINEQLPSSEIVVRKCGLRIWPVDRQTVSVSQ